MSIYDVHPDCTSSFFFPLSIFILKRSDLKFKEKKKKRKEKDLLKKKAIPEGSGFFLANNWKQIYMGGWKKGRESNF